MKKNEIGLLYELQKKLQEREQEKFEILNKTKTCPDNLNDALSSLDFSIQNLKKAIEDLNRT